MKNIKLNFHIFETCNMNCKFCFRRKDILKLNDKWKEAIDLIANDGKINYLNIAGGEPTINKNLLIEILEYIKFKLFILNSTIKFRTNTISKSY